MAQLYAQAPGTHFGRLLRPAVGLFVSPATTLVTPLMLQSLAMSNEKDSYSPRSQPTWLEQARRASTEWETHVCPTVCPSVRFCSTRHGTAGGKCSNKSVLIGVVDIPWCTTGRCFSNWRPASEEDDFGRVPTCYLPAEDSATLPSRFCSVYRGFTLSHFQCFPFTVFKMYQNTVIYFLFGNSAWPLGLQQHYNVKVCDDEVTRKLRINTSERY